LRPRRLRSRSRSVRPVLYPSTFARQESDRLPLALLPPPLAGEGWGGGTVTTIPTSPPLHRPSIGATRGYDTLGPSRQAQGDTVGSTTTAQWDVVVVGASFAGAACALAARRAGLRVCVLERKRDPGMRLHTTGIIVRE